MDYKRYNEKKYEEGYWNVNRSKYKWFSNYARLKIFKKFASECKNKGVFLDAGGGVGNWAYHFLPDFEKVIVLDISKRALDQIPEKAIIKRQGSVLDMPIESESIDCLLLSDVFEHISLQDLDQLIEELKRVLRKEGVLIIFTSQYGYGMGVVINRIKGDIHNGLAGNEKVEGHLNRLRFNEIKKLIKKHGLKIENYYHYSIFFQNITDYVKNRLAESFDKKTKRKSARPGQEIKNKIKRQDRMNPFLKEMLRLFSFISYLDIVLFGKVIPGDAIFLKMKKLE